MHPNTRRSNRCFWRRGSRVMPSRGERIKLTVDPNRLTVEAKSVTSPVEVARDELNRVNP